MIELVAAAPRYSTLFPQLCQHPAEIFILLANAEGCMKPSAESLQKHGPTLVLSDNIRSAAEYFFRRPTELLDNLSNKHPLY